MNPSAIIKLGGADSGTVPVSRARANDEAHPRQHPHQDQ